MRRAALLAAAAVLPGLAAAQPLATSSRLGLEVTPGATPWCAAVADLRVSVVDQATTGRPEFLALLQRVGTAVVAQQCPQAREVRFLATLAGGNEPLWRGVARAAEGWAPHAGSGEATDLDAAPAAPAPAEPGRAAAQILRPSGDGRAVALLDQRVTLAARGEYEWQVRINGRAVGQEGADLPPRIVDARALDGRGYVLVNFPSAGRVCPAGTYALLVIGPGAPRLHRDVGTCDPGAPAVTLDHEGWRASQPGPRAEQVTHVILRDGGIEKRVEARPAQARGPAEGDPRTLLRGRPIWDLFAVRPADAALRAAMPPEDYAFLREKLMNGQGVAFERRGEWLVAHGDETRRGEELRAAIAFGPGGAVAARVTRGGRERLYGSDAPTARQILRALF